MQRPRLRGFTLIGLLVEAVRQHYQQALDLSPEFAPAQEAFKSLP